MTQFSQLDQLQQLIAARAQTGAADSYVVKLLRKGATRAAKKLGEEAVETAIAVAQNDTPEVIKESADLLFHLLVVWQAMGIAPSAVMAELAAREGISGLAEKASRTE